MNKPIFENEEEALEFTTGFIMSYFRVEDITSELRNRIIKNYKVNGLIKQSELERARENYDNGFSADYVDRVKNYVYELEKEIERLNIIERKFYENP